MVFITPPLSCSEGGNMPVFAWWCWDLPPVPAPLPVAAGQRQRSIRAVPADAAAGTCCCCCCWRCVRVCCIIHAWQAVPCGRLCDLRGVVVVPSAGEVCRAGWRRRSPGCQAGGGAPKVRRRQLRCWCPSPRFHVGAPPVGAAAVDALHHACLLHSRGLAESLEEGQGQSSAAAVDCSQTRICRMDAPGCDAALKRCIKHPYT
jgi:hypothetical protein